MSIRVSWALFNRSCLKPWKNICWTIFLTFMRQILYKKIKALSEPFCASQAAGWIVSKTALLEHGTSPSSLNLNTNLYEKDSQKKKKWQQKKKKSKACSSWSSWWPLLLVRGQLPNQHAAPLHTPVFDNSNYIPGNRGKVINTLLWFYYFNAAFSFCSNSMVTCCGLLDLVKLNKIHSL